MCSNYVVNYRWLACRTNGRETLVLNEDELELFFFQSKVLFGFAMKLSHLLPQGASVASEAPFAAPNLLTCYPLSLSADSRLLA